MVALRVGILLGFCLAADVGRAAPPRDRYGDPLPPGAVQRLGTTRFRIRDQAAFLGLSPDGKAFLSLGTDGKLRFRDLYTDKLLREVRLCYAEQSVAAQSGDGKTLAIALAEELLLRDVRTGAELGRVRKDDIVKQPGQQGAKEPVIGNLLFYLSHDGQVLFAVGVLEDEAPLLCWLSAKTGKCLHRTALRKGATFSALTVTRDGKTMALVETDQAAGNKLRLRSWDVPTGKERPEMPLTRALEQVTLVGDGRTFLAGDGEEAVRLFDTASGMERRVFTEDDAPAIGFALAPDDKTLFVVTNDHIRQWDLATGKAVRDLKFSPRAGVGGAEMAVSADGRLLAACGRDCLTLWDLRTGKELHPTDGHTGEVGGLAFAPRGDRLLSTGSSSDALLWDLAAGRELRSLEPVGTPADAAVGARLPWGQMVQGLVSPDGKELAVAWPAYPIHLYGTDRKRPPRHFGDGKVALTGAFGPGGRLFAAGGQDGQVRVWDVATSRERHRLLWSLPVKEEDGVPGMLTAVAFAQDGKTLAAAGLLAQNNETKLLVRLWETATGGERRRLEFAVPSATGVNPQGLVGAAALWSCVLQFSPDGKRLALGVSDGVYLWDLDAGKELQHFCGLEVSFVACAISPDWKLLAAAKAGGKIRLWRLEDGTVLRDVTAHGQPVLALAFSPDSKRLASGSADSTVLLWDVAELLKAAPTPRPGPSVADAELVKRLGTADAGTAYQAVRTLTRHPAEAVAALKASLKPVTPVKEGQLAKLLADLADERAAVREPASRTLEDLAELAGPALHKLLAEEPSPELRRRAEMLLGKLEGSPTSAAMLRALRGIEVLEHAGSAEARQLLETLAAGAPGHRVTVEARAALERLTRHQDG
jgi:WD40 repeat protein